MSEALHQPIRLRVAFSLLAVFLLVAAATAWGAAALLPVGILFAAVGLVVLLTSRGTPPVTRWATFGIFGYVVLWVFTFLASTSVTLKKGYWVNAHPPAWAAPVQDLLVAGLPLVFLVGIGAALWEWSPRPGRAALGVAGGLLVLSLAFGALSAPDKTEVVPEDCKEKEVNPGLVCESRMEVTPADRAAAERYASLALGAFSLACVAEVAALGFLLARPPVLGGAVIR